MKNNSDLPARSLGSRSLFVSLALLAQALVLPAATTIGWNNQGVGGVGLADSDSAGAPGFEQSHWNNHSSNGQAPGTVPLDDLVDSTGNATSMTVAGWSQSSNNSWQHNQTDNPNEVLTNDFANREPSLNFSAIPYETYDVVVYYGNNEGPSTSLLELGGLERTITTGNTTLSSFRAVGFVEGTAANTTEPTNFTVFSGLSGSTQTVSLSGANNNGISAIQFVESVPIPEPGSIGLFCLGAFLMTQRRPRGRS